jgi:hypothetical protein
MIPIARFTHEHRGSKGALWYHNSMLLIHLDHDATRYLAVRSAIRRPFSRSCHALKREHHTCLYKRLRVQVANGVPPRVTRAKQRESLA